jgi:hypothetical protein
MSWANPSSRRRLPTICGAKLPSRTRDTSIWTGRISVRCAFIHRRQVGVSDHELAALEVDHGDRCDVCPATMAAPSTVVPFS